MSETIHVHRRQAPFTIVYNDIWEDERLHWKSKAILGYLLGKPSGWKLRIKDLENKSQDGNRAVRSALKELQKVGYVKLIKVKDEKHRIVEWQWHISDFAEKPNKSPDVRFAQVENPHVENERPSNTDSSNNHDSNTEVLKEPKESPHPVVDSFDEKKVIPARWKPDPRSKQELLDALPVPDDYPSQAEFDDFILDSGLSGIERIFDLYERLCRDKWHVWKPRANKWVRVRDWHAFIQALNDKVEDALPSNR